MCLNFCYIHGGLSLNYMLFILFLITVSHDQADTMYDVFFILALVSKFAIDL
jgi:hypothetical protein